MIVGGDVSLEGVLPEPLPDGVVVVPGLPALERLLVPCPAVCEQPVIASVTARVIIRVERGVRLNPLSVFMCFASMPRRYEIPLIWGDHSGAYIQFESHI